MIFARYVRFFQPSLAQHDTCCLTNAGTTHTVAVHVNIIVCFSTRARLIFESCTTHVREIIVCYCFIFLLFFFKRNFFFFIISTQSFMVIICAVHTTYGERERPSARRTLSRTHKLHQLRERRRRRRGVVAAVKPSGTRGDGRTPIGVPNATIRPVLSGTVPLSSYASRCPERTRTFPAF